MAHELCPASARFVVEALARIRAAEADFMAVLAKEARENSLWAEHARPSWAGRARPEDHAPAAHEARFRAALDDLIDEALDQSLIEKAGEIA